MRKKLPARQLFRFWKNAVRVCVECGSTENLTIDHTLALVLGGTNAMSNLRVLCRPCNQAKGEKEWATKEAQTAAVLQQLPPALPRHTLSPAQAAEARKQAFLALMNPKRK